MLQADAVEESVGQVEDVPDRGWIGVDIDGRSLTADSDVHTGPADAHMQPGFRLSPRPASG